MNEKDREYLKTVNLELSKLPETVSSMIAEKLLSIIDRLNKRLTKVKEAGEPILNGLKFYKTCPDDIQLSVVETKITEIAEFTVGHLRRLDKALKEVKHGEH